MKIEEVLKILEGKKLSPNDVIYELFRSEKKSFLFHLWDMIFDTILSTKQQLFEDKVIYPVASDTRGQLIEIENGKIVS